MVFPPPPALSFLAYMSGSITETELIDLVRLREEKHAPDRDGDNRFDMGEEVIKSDL